MLYTCATEIFLTVTHARWWSLHAGRNPETSVFETSHPPGYFINIHAIFGLRILAWVFLERHLPCYMAVVATYSHVKGVYVRCEHCSGCWSQASKPWSCETEAFFQMFSGGKTQCADHFTGACISAFQHCPRWNTSPFGEIVMLLYTKWSSELKKNCS